MAVYLLNGGKMLSEVCPVCGAPLFSVKGRKTCVVCEERAKESAPAEKKIAAAANNPEDSGKIVQITPAYAKPAADHATPDLDSLIAGLIARAREERDPEKCLVLMQCLRTAAETKTMLTRLP